MPIAQIEAERFGGDNLYSEAEIAVVLLVVDLRVVVAGAVAISGHGEVDPLVRLHYCPPAQMVDLVGRLTGVCVAWSGGRIRGVRPHYVIVHSHANHL